MKTLAVLLLLSAAGAMCVGESQELPPLSFAPVSGSWDEGDERSVQLRLRATGLWWHDTKIIADKLPGYVNGLLKYHAGKQGEIGGVSLYVSEDVTFGSLMDAVGQLRKTDAIFVVVNMNVLKEPNQTPEPTRANVRPADGPLGPRGSS